MIDLAAVPWDSVGTVGLALIVMGLVVTGRLVPRATVRAIQADQQKHTAYAETEATEQRATISALVDQVAKLSTTGELSVALLQAIKGANNTQQSGSTHVASSIPE